MHAKQKISSHTAVNVYCIISYSTFCTLCSVLSQSGEISPDFCCFYGGGIRHNEDIMHSFQNFIVRLIPNHPPPLETRIWKLVVRALIVLFLKRSIPPQWEISAIQGGGQGEMS